MTEFSTIMRLGTVVSTDSGPNVMEFSFVLEGGPREIIARRGEFISVVTDDGTVIARVQNNIAPFFKMCICVNPNKIVLREL